MNRKLIRAAAAVTALAALLLLPACKSHKTEEAPSAGSSSSSGSSSSVLPEPGSSADGSQSLPEQPVEPDLPAPPAEPDVSPVAPPAVPTPQPETAPAFLNFPYAIPDTDLVVETVNSYDGHYLEDGSDISISGVSAILLRNTGDQYLDYVRIRMEGDKTSFEFVASGIAPGTVLLVQEAGKAPSVTQGYLRVTADTALAEPFSLSEDSLRLEDTADGKLRVTNISGRDIPCARIFYKFCLPDQNVYLGGITYTAKLVDLKAGASLEIAPSHYVPGESKIIMARLYSSAEE